MSSKSPSKKVPQGFWLPSAVIFPLHHNNFLCFCHRKPKFTMVTPSPWEKLNDIDYFLFRRAEKYLVQCISWPPEENSWESGNFSHLKWVISWGHGFTLNCLEKSDGCSPAESWLEVIHCERSDHLVGSSLQSVPCFPKFHLRFLFPQGYLMNGKKYSTKRKWQDLLLGVKGDFRHLKKQTGRWSVSFWHNLMTWWFIFYSMKEPGTWEMPGTNVTKNMLLLWTPEIKLTLGTF